MQTFFFLSRLALLIAVTGLTVIAAKYSVHMLQLEGYFLSQFPHHLFARIRRPSLLFHPAPVKKPLKVTARVVRLFICIGLLAALLGAVLIFGLNAWFGENRPFWLFGVLPIPLASPLTFLAALIMQPIENAIRRWFVRDARKRLEARPDLKIVAITGSYGKTSTKFILSSILSEKFAVLTPPASYNTTMGVVRVIRERLQPDDEVFICEMGSRHIGDIREICDFVHPTACILTSIGPQHLDTFGSIEGVKKGKYELVEAVGPAGTAVFASGNDDILSLYEKAPCTKMTAGFRPEDAVRAENVSVGSSGSAFTLVLPDGSRTECVTRLLGEHNIANILTASAMAYAMGLTAAEIARGIKKIEPVEHRLQIVQQAPITIIDDAFNASPNGAKAALKVLGSFTGRRIIVTPGFVELGKDEDKYHFALGQQIAENADAAILVGKKRVEKIREGLGDFSGEIHVVSTLNEATAILRQMAIAGDVVLFENDLPDNYNE